MSGRTARTLALVAVAAVLTLGSCVGESIAPRSRLFSVPTAPANDSPAGALRLLEWTWNHQDPDRYCVLFPEDFRFTFSALDPYGNAYRDAPWTREDEMAFAEHLFEGGHPTEPPATSIVLTLDRNFIVDPDPRPGKHARWHKHVRSSLGLRVVTVVDQTEITGFASFFLVRGDSASAPGCGGPADSSHWYVERWEDETGASSASQANPAKKITLGSLKALYR